MTEAQQADWFQDIDAIVSEPLNFKAKLAIGEEAYKSLKVKNAVVQAWDVAGVATTAAVVAKSSVVASTFFAPTGFLAAIGLATAVTPVGWVIAASVFSGGAWYGITRHLKKRTADKVTIVPNFINTPLDVLALGLFDLLAPLALKVAGINDSINPSRHRQIQDYFVREWGYDAEFVEEGFRYIESRDEPLSIEALAATLADFARNNPDCNFKLMSLEICGFLKSMVSVEGAMTDSEQTAIERIDSIFQSANQSEIQKRVAKSLRSIKKLAQKPFKRRSDGN